MTKLNKTGDKGHPCLTPDVVGIVVRLQVVVVSQRRLSIRQDILGCMLMCFRTSLRNSRFTESYALEKSTKVA